MIEHVSKTGKGVPSRHGLRTSVVKIIRRIQRVRRRTTLHSKSTTEVVNLFPNPRLRTDGETASHLIQGPCQLAGVYVPPQSMAALAEVPGRAGVVGLVVAGSGPRNDTYVAPGGRNSPGAFRLGMAPGRTFTVTAHVYLPDALTGSLRVDALRIVVGTIHGNRTRWGFAKSHPAPNEMGDHRLTVTFTIPPDATGAWIRLMGGASKDNGILYWHSLMVTETPHPIKYFDGSTLDDPFYTYQWLGKPDASRSRRQLRTRATMKRLLGDTAAEAIASKAEELWMTGEVRDADILISYLRELGHTQLYLLATAKRGIASGDHEAAENALRTLEKLGDPTGEAAFHLGVLSEVRRDWPTAAARYREALEKQPNSAIRAYRLAGALERQGLSEESRKLVAEGLSNDSALTFDGAFLLERKEKDFLARRDIAIFVAENLPEIRARATRRLERHTGSYLRMPVFMYWGQGFLAAPPVVQACRSAVTKHVPSSQLHLLDDTTYPYYVDIPEAITAAIGENRTHFSDLLRLALLERYGGVWVDATCLVSQPLVEPVERLLSSSDFFAFRYGDARISSWFLASSPDSYIVHLWRAALFLWWERRAELTCYYLLHYFFEVLYYLDDQFRKEWDKSVPLSSQPPHELQKAMFSDFDPARYNDIVRGSFVHKLTHKVRADQPSSNSFLSHVIRGDLPQP